MKAKFKRISIAGGDSWVNTGDEAILLASLRLFKSLNPNISIRIISGDKSKTEQQFPDYEIVDRRNIIDFVKSLHDTDLYVWGGGHLIQNSSSKIFLMYHYFLLLLVILNNVELVGFCVGVEPINGKFWQKITRKILNKFSSISVRDERSKEILQKLKVSTRIFVSSDPAIILSPDKSIDEELSKTQIQPYVVFSVRRWFDYRSSFLPIKFIRKVFLTQDDRFIKLINDLALLCDWIVDKYSVNIVFVPMYIANEQSDDIVAEQIVEQMKFRNKTFVLKKQYPPEQLIGFISNSQFLFGMRMHSTILGACARVPIIELYYQGKGKSFFSALGLQNNAISVGDYSIEKLKHVIDNVVRDRESYIEIITSSMMVLQEKINNNMKFLYKEFFGYD